MRLFIALRLPPEMTEALRRVQDELRRRGVEGNYTKPENLHLTLAFIGEYPSAEPVLEALETLRFRPFRLELGGLGSFGELWWAGIRENEALDALARRLRRALAEAGIPFDKKRFRPHLTLIRRSVCRGGARIGTVLVPPAEMLVDKISLMLSTRGRSGVIYTELGSVSASEEEND